MTTNILSMKELLETAIVAFGQSLHEYFQQTGCNHIEESVNEKLEGLYCMMDSVILLTLSTQALIMKHLDSLASSTKDSFQEYYSNETRLAPLRKLVLQPFKLKQKEVETLGRLKVKFALRRHHSELMVYLSSLQLFQENWMKFPHSD